MPSLTQLALSAAAGGLTTLSPCVFPILPVVMGGALQGGRWGPVAMGLGMATSFAAIGMLVGALGSVVGLDGDTVRYGGAIMLIAFALVLVIPKLSERFANFMLPIANSANAMSSKVDGRSLWGALMLGAILGLVWSPCSGPLLGSALALVASEGGVGRGGLILGVFGLGAAIPLVAVAYLSRGTFLKARGWVIGRAEALQRAFGVLLGLTGIAVLLGWDKRLEAVVIEWLPEAWINLTVGI